MADPTDPSAPVVKQTPIDKSASLGLALAAVGAGLFATKGIFVKLALAEGLDAVTVLTWRMLIAVPVFATVGWLGLRERWQSRGPQAGKPIPPKAVLLACLVGVLGYYLASFLDFEGLSYISAQLNRLILLTYPFFVLVFAAILFKRPITPKVMGAALVAYLGIGLIFARDMAVEGENIVFGTLLVLGAAVAYALYQLFAKPLIDTLGARLFTSIAMAAAGVIVVIHFLITHPLSALALSPYAFSLMVGIAMVATVLPAYAIAAAIGHIGPERTAIFGNISPLITIVLAVLLLGEPFTLFHALGTALVICGILLFTRLTRNRT